MLWLPLAFRMISLFAWVRVVFSTRRRASCKLCFFIRRHAGHPESLAALDAGRLSSLQCVCLRLPRVMLFLGQSQHKGACFVSRFRFFAKILDCDTSYPLRGCILGLFSLESRWFISPYCLFRKSNVSRFEKPAEILDCDAFPLLWDVFSRHFPWKSGDLHPVLLLSEGECVTIRKNGRNFGS